MSDKVSAKDRLVNALCGNSKRKLLNVKFCRGTAVAIDDEDFASQIEGAMFDVENGRAVSSNRFPEASPQVRVKDLVAKHA